MKTSKTNRKENPELTWIGKEVRPKLEPRILLEDPAKSYCAEQRVTNADLFDNRLIFGDNLLALKALEQEYTGKVKCIYIDPPFNTGEMFEHYDDGIEHSIWLGQMRDRLILLRNLLSLDGTLFVHIDDNEIGYLMVLLDEIFGRGNRLYTITFKQGSATGHKAINPGCVSTTNFLLMYARDRSLWSPTRVFTARERDERYGQFIENVQLPHEKWTFTTLMKAFSASQGIAEKAARTLAKEQPELLDSFVINNAASVIQLARPSYDGVGADTRRLIDESERCPGQVLKLERDGYSDIYLIGGKRILFYSDKLKLIDGNLVAGEPLTTLWDDILSNNLHAEGGVAFPKGKKPEALIKRILELVTTPGDIVLDSFAGSGTTGAVAHKMGRRWIMVELGEHCHTHIIPRMKKVIDGQDSGGVTAATGWKGGGGFRYFKLAPQDKVMKTSKTWLVLDCPFLCYRAFHTTGQLEMGTTFGFLKSVLSLMSDLNCRNPVFCFDSKYSKRSEKYSQYKAERKEKERNYSEEERKQYAQMREEVAILRREVLPELGYQNIFVQKGYEADDMIASVCANIGDMEDAIIVSSDRDLYQLLRKRVIIYKPIQQEIYTEAKLAEQFAGITPSQWIQVKAIAGCVSDGIKGIKGVGEVTAAKFLRGMLKEGAAVEKKILAAKKEWKQNLDLIKLPYFGVKECKPSPDNVSSRDWRDVLEKYNMRSLVRGL